MVSKAQDTKIYYILYIIYIHIHMYNIISVYIYIYIMYHIHIYTYVDIHRCRMLIKINMVVHLQLLHNSEGKLKRSHYSSACFVLFMLSNIFTLNLYKTQ